MCFILFKVKEKIIKIVVKYCRVIFENRLFFKRNIVTTEIPTTEFAVSTTFIFL